MNENTEDGNWDLISTPEQGVIKTHGTNDCQGRPCCVHNPSDHHMRTWPMIFDVKKIYMALRVCEHGYSHPDPDSVHYFLWERCVSPNVGAWLLLHQCDGCCLSEPFDGPIDPFAEESIG